eukprot:TRINITY_DN4812_c0_g1_i3.p1 TRINITY_DN4812_c0_g1~~TRINITY_DN4812_c0_g1_i3.p1  ORF type:complete len:480 (+),score=29.84 TRINITY_DN4812_c0_g1_i3:75-1514(+)
MRAMARDRSFAAAVNAIDLLIPKGPPPSATVAAPAGPGPSPSQRTNEEGMAWSLMRLGITDENLNKLNVVHISGTKGKGSTAAMCDSIFRQRGLKTGLFTSPHLMSVTERVRINGHPIAEDKFAESFWHVWDALQQTEVEAETVPKSTFFRLMTLVALRSFLEERVDVTILEVGLGGRLDSTNVVTEPIVCGTTHIGYDHVAVLGNTLTLIASEKAGIAKSGVPYLIAPNQAAEAQISLIKHAAERGAYVATAPSLDTYPGGEGVHLGLEGLHQRDNAALAVALCSTYFEKTKGMKFSFIPDGLAPGEVAEGPREALPEDFVQGLSVAKWDGRCQTVVLPVAEGSAPVTLRIDGAHTDESVAAASAWFAALPTGTPPARREVLFHCQPGRDPAALLTPIRDALCTGACSDIAQIHFTPLLSSKQSLVGGEASPEALAWVQLQKDAWDALVCHGCEVDHGARMATCITFMYLFAGYWRAE